MKKLLCLIITAALCLPFAACVEPESPTSNENAVKPKIIATTFPQYDWLRQLLGDEIQNIDLILLAKNGVDLHSFQPSVDDIADISTCDLLVYVGGESDAWVRDVAPQNESFTAISLMDILGSKVKTEQLKEGMEHDHNDHGHNEEDEHDDHGEEHAEDLDEHVWLSLKNAADICGALAEELCRILPEKAEVFRANADAYVSKLNALDEEYAAALGNAPVKTLLFAGRFPFRYLMDDYGLDYYAAFPGCSAETEASFETIAFLAAKTDELALRYIMVIETSDKAIARTVINSTAEKNQSILTLDSVQSVTADDIDMDYLSVMRGNLDILKQATGE